MFNFAGKRILVTGACGTVGSELIRQMLVDSPDAPELVIGVDNNESELFFLQERFRGNHRVKLFLGDIRDQTDLHKRLRGINVVFHAAALKHVILCEGAPDQAILTNIVGVQNVIAASIAAGCERVVLTSSDKAVNPTSVMGTSKLIGEKLITAAAVEHRGGNTVFVSTRFGNVLGSNGSVVEVFRRQIAAGGPITITDARMTRFVMGVDDAVRLVIDTASLAIGGEVFITKMPVIRIPDLASAMIAETFVNRPSSARIEVVTIGVKPGEKLYEELMNSEETRRAIELDQYFVIPPPLVESQLFDREAAYGPTLSSGVSKPYVSSDEPCLSVNQIRELLRAKRLI